MNAIRSILVRPEKKGQIVHLEEAIVHPHGIQGDHYVRPEVGRAVTLIAGRELAEAAAVVGFQGDAHAASRRNIMVDEFPEADMKGKRIALGEEVILEITSYCTPCSRMDENFGKGAVQALDQRAGWCAIVIRDGQIRIGDSFRLL